MATKFLDLTGLSYFWDKLKGYFQPKLVSGTNIKTINNTSLLGNGNIDIIADDTIAFYRKVENVYTTQSANETTIPVGISGLRSIDMLLVNINGLDLAEGVDFNRSGTNIVLTTPISAVGQAVHFTALRAVSASTQDYSVLKGDDGVVQDVLQNGVSVLGQDGVARIVAETDVGTSTPTADTTAKFDGDAHMNSTDMTTGSGSELEDFIDGLNVSGGGAIQELFTATRNSSATDGTFTGVYDPLSGIVTFTATVRFSSNIGTNTTLFTLPEKYRPKTNLTVPAIVFTDANAPITYAGTIYTSGVITQNASGYARQIFISGSYSVK